jgi:hypothetical protein
VESNPEQPTDFLAPMFRQLMPDVYDRLSSYERRQALRWFKSLRITMNDDPFWVAEQAYSRGVVGPPIFGGGVVVMGGLLASLAGGNAHKVWLVAVGISVLAVGVALMVFGG